MATLLHSESRRLYSWWWDSHISPKNSKWLQENLTDMDAKVKSMIKLIEEDADSFARRAEMYYKKRPELMKLVEEFYRAYRALAERYNHATGELRHAHRTIAKAFPDQVPFELTEDSPFLDDEQDLPDLDLHSLKKSGPQKEGSEGGMRKKGLKQLHEIVGALEAAAQGSKSAERKVPKEKLTEESSHNEVIQLTNEIQDLKDKILHEIDRAGRAENEVQGLKKALTDMKTEKEDVLFQYQGCLEKQSRIEEELENAQKDSMIFNEKAGRAEIEVQTLKEALTQLETERNAGFVKHQMLSDKISSLEAMLSQVHEEKKDLDNIAIVAECEAQTMRDEISRLKLEKEAVHRQYELCLGKISDLESVISNNEDQARLLKTRAERAEIEVSELNKALAYLNKEKEDSALRYKCCLQTIAKLEEDLSISKEDINRLNKEVLVGNAKLKTTEEKCTLLEMSNQSLRIEANNLAKKIAGKDQELSEKQEKMDNLQTCLKEEHSRHVQVEATLRTLQNLHSRSQDDQKALTSELKNLLQVVNELETSKTVLEEEIQQARNENESLTQTSLSAAVSMENMQRELTSLRNIKEKLEKEVSKHMGQSDSIQQEISALKEEIKSLNMSYQALVEQIEAAGLNPKCVRTSIKSLQDENSELRRICEQENNEKAILSEKIENMAEVLKEKVLLESSLSDLNGELEGSHKKMKAMQESCQSFHNEKAALVAEKASLLSQLLSVTENMHKLLEKNAVLENSLSMAKVELEGLRERSKGLEEICELLKNEKSYILSKRSSLALKLEHVERRLEALEKRFSGLEEKCVGLEKEKEAMYSQVEELKLSLGVEKEERLKSHIQNETKMVGLQNQINLLQEENKWKKKEFEDELEKALKAQFEISILQKFMKDMEEKNYSLIVECQKHVEASKLAEKLISELESETLEQQVESELLLDEIERLRLGIDQIFKALEETVPDDIYEDKVENGRTFIHHILGIIEDMKFSISEYKDDKQLLLVENSVLLALLEELESKGKKIESQKAYLEKEFKIMAEKFAVVENEKERLLEMNTKLKSDVSHSNQHAVSLEAELGSLSCKQAGLHEAYGALQEEYSQVNRDNEYLLKKFSDLTEEKDEADKPNDAVLLECLALASQSEVFRCFGADKIIELKLLLEDLNSQREVNDGLEKEMCLLKEKLELQKAENVVLKDAVVRLEGEMLGIRECNVQLKQDMLSGKENLLQAERKLFDAQVKLESVEKLNSNLCRTVDELKSDVQESHHVRENLEKDVLQLSENISIQEKEIKSLHLVNTNLEAELGLLCEEIEEKTIREQVLSSELQNKNNEFEMWESEATAFYFDFQISSINEVLFENKVQELTGACQNLEKERDSKISEIEEMKRKMCSMESEISGLKSQIGAYGPIIASLRDDITFIEHNALQTKLKTSRLQEPEFEDVAARPSTSSFDVPMEDETLLSLQNLQSRVKAVGKLMEEMNKPILSRRSSSIRKQESEFCEIELMKPQHSLGRNNSRKKGLRTKAAEARNGMLMKDIPLDANSSRRGLRKKGQVGSDDQMLELWESAKDGPREQTIGESLRMSYKMTEWDILYDHRKIDPPSTESDMEKELGVDKLELSTRIMEPILEVNDKKILERLASDAQKLETLQTTVQTLKRQLETNKKGRKVKNVDFETVDEQLLEAEETVVHLVDLNNQLVKDIEEYPSPDGKASPKMKEAVETKRKKVTERARKGSERIGRLQLELQKIQYMLLKMEDEKSKGRNKFLKSKTIILRDFIYNGRKNSLRRKKSPLCGCLRPSTSRNGRSSTS